MKRITLIGLILFASCSQIRHIERLADKGDITFCDYAVNYYSTHTYKTEQKRQEKIIKYCKKGLSLKVDTNKFNQAYDYADFYRELANSPLINKKDKYLYYQQGAKYNDNESQWIIGLYYLEGTGGQIKNDSALYWFNKASNGNDNYYGAAATKELANIYYEGKLVKADTMKAVYYYKRACACFGESSDFIACDSVIAFYKKQKNIKDTTELSIYSELERQLRGEKYKFHGEYIR